MGAYATRAINDIDVPRRADFSLLDFFSNLLKDRFNCLHPYRRERSEDLLTAGGSILGWLRKPLTDVRGSVDSVCFRTATVRERLAPLALAAQAGVLES